MLVYLILHIYNTNELNDDDEHLNDDDNRPMRFAV